jgi:hypothetical protein
MTGAPREAAFGGNGRAIAAGLALGAAGFVALLLEARAEPRAAALAYLVAYVFGVTTALGALTLLMIGHAVNAAWIVAIRRPIEAAAAATPAFALLFLPLVAWLRVLYPWVAPAASLPEHALAHLRERQAYFDVPAFLARAAVCFAVWGALAVLLRRASVRGDRDAARAPALAAHAKTLSAAGFAPLGLTITLAAFDWVMGLEPMWTSSALGVYVFAGGFAAALGLAILLTAALDRARLLPAIHASHYHALGKLALTAVIFWAYIAYFQGMLVWIADVPEESTWYVERTRGAAGRALVVVAALEFVLPFAALLSRALKRRPWPLAAVAAVVVAGHYVDVAWLVLPARGGDAPWPAAACAAALLAVVGPAVAWSALLLRGAKTAPENDPRLAASLGYRTS